MICFFFLGLRLALRPTRDPARLVLAAAPLRTAPTRATPPSTAPSAAAAPGTFHCRRDSL